MCGRFTLRHTASEVQQRFEVQQLSFEMIPRYNIAPSQEIPVVKVNSPRSLEAFQWGLVPFWSKDPTIGNKLLNAPAETLSEKPSFKYALTRRRCIIPSDGFYEWKREGKAKQPMYIGREDGEVFGFAGLWEEWKSPDGNVLRTATIITVEPNELMADIHNRMPAILLPEDEETWLDTSIKDIPQITSLLAPYPTELMKAYPVSTRVNSPSFDGEECIQPL